MTARVVEDLASDVKPQQAMLNRRFAIYNELSLMTTARRFTTGLRPLAAAHWSLPVGIVASALLLTFGQPCKEGPRYVELGWLVLTICVILWSNHLKVAPAKSISQVVLVLVQSIKDGGLLLIWTVLAALPLAILTPTYQCYTNRARASEVVLAAVGLRTQVEEAILTKGVLTGSGKDVKFKPFGRAIAGRVSTDGEIVVIGEDPPVVFFFSPVYEKGKVTWKCRGYPRKVVPISCRSEDET